MPELTTSTLISFALVCLAGSTMSTVIGFGLNIVLVSIFQFLLPPVQLVAMATLLGLANAALRAVESRRVDTGGITVRVLGAGVCGVPIGVALLFVARADHLKLLFSVLVLLSALTLMMAGGRSSTPTAPRRAKLGQLLFGALGGFTTGAASMPGPPVVWCSLRQDWEKSAAHAVFARYFVVTGLVALLMFWWGGAYDRATVRLSLGLLPCVAAGVFVGTRLRRRVSQSQFRRFAAWGLVVLALVAATNTVVKMMQG